MKAEGRLSLRLTVAMASLTFCSLGHADVYHMSSGQTSLQWVTVGNPGNAANPLDVDPRTPGDQTRGAVSQAFKIGKYDVTVNQYVEFLNAKDPSGANLLGLYNDRMSTFGGISFQTDNTNGSKYATISGRGNHPAASVTWFGAVRFTNWLSNGQGSGDTETGTYTLGPLGIGGVPVNGGTITRNPGATVFLPSMDEWHKAAYYNPATSSYFQYPTSSNTAPITSAATSLINHVNSWPNGPNYLTDVGAYSGTTSPYGAFDMAGNVWQWSDDLFYDMPRGLLGGSFGQDWYQSNFWGVGEPTLISGQVGFRVAAIVPEPSPFALAILAVATSLLASRRLRSK
jgi:formylglycine-generating enzyme